ncbi:MAG: adenylate/guanylate cyclase domain-containing protein [Nitrospinae bacterium]|nr:adenylate/guanylate cyclase domain-containing protein [Nitrospinota bacterium]
MSDTNETGGNTSDEHDLDALLREKEQLESLIKRKFTKNLTVMFTDLTGSTRMAEEIGDIAMHSLLSRHYEIVRPAVEMNAGVLVKTMGDGTLSYFKEAADALRAAIEIEKKMAVFNQDSAYQLLVRCGLNTGPTIVEKNDIYGDTVNVAQRYEAMGKPLDILISADTYRQVQDDPSFTIFFNRQTEIKGKIGPQKVYKVLWSPDEIDAFLHHPPDPSVPYNDGAVTGDVPIPDGAKGVDLAVGASRTLGRLKIVRDGAPPKYYDLTERPAVIGRSSSADIQIPEMYISRKHALISLEGGEFYIEDMGSHVGTYKNDERIAKARMNDGDRFSIGGVKIYFTLSSATHALETDFPVQEDPTVAFAAGSVMTLVLKENDEIAATYPIDREPLVLGRQIDCDIRLESPMISRRHAQIHVEKGVAIVEDLGSNNGTYVRGEKIKRAELLHCDEFRVGPFSLQVIDPTRPATGAETESSIVRKVFSFLKKP